jgi:hypothetical protein
VSAPVLKLVEFRRWIRVADDIGIKIHHRNHDAVFDFEITELVKIMLPAAILRKIIRHAFGKKDVPGIAAIHYSLRDVNPSAGNVGALVHILDLMHRSTVNAHAYWQPWLGAQRLADL